MFNEMPTTPVHPSSFLPEWQHSQERGRDRNDTLNSLTNLNQNTPTGKKKRKDDTVYHTETQNVFGENFGGYHTLTQPGEIRITPQLSLGEFQSHCNSVSKLITP